MAETREDTNAQEGASIRRRTRARGHKHAKAHPREKEPHESAHPREGAPARRELNPGTRARLRWLRLAASGGGWLQHHFANAHPEAFVDGKIPRNAFSTGRQWQDIRLKLSPSSNRGKIFT